MRNLLQKPRCCCCGKTSIGGLLPDTLYVCDSCIRDAMAWLHHYRLADLNPFYVMLLYVVAPHVLRNAAMNQRDCESVRVYTRDTGIVDETVRFEPTVYKKVLDIMRYDGYPMTLGRKEPSDG